MHKYAVRLHKTPPSPPLHVWSAGAYEAPQGKDYPLHQHTYWELVYYRAGHIACPIGTELHEAGPGTLLLTPPGTPHAERALTAYANQFVGLQAPADQPWPRVCLDAGGEIGPVFGALVREWAGEAPGRGEMLTLLAAQLDVLLRRRAGLPPVSEAEELTRRAEALLADGFAARLTVSEAARQVGVTPAALRRAFAQTRGVSPGAYLQAVRGRRALALLRHSTLTLDAVADLCGYHSASHLSRHVKRLAGVPPGALRVAREEGPHS